MRKPKGYWTKERCHEETLKYNSRKEFQSKSSGSYNSAKINDWLDDICLHMLKKTPYWTKENCKNESLKYLNKNQFKINSGGAYNASRKNGWLDEFFPKNSIN